MNLFAYCGNNPVMLMDPSGHFGFLIGLIVAISTALVAAAATANDIYQITRKDEGKVEVSTSNDNVHINNSYKILTPWMRFGYSFYLNHINNTTKDIIKGSTYGVEFEWMVHNVLAWIGGGESAKHLDVGATIFSDGTSHPLREKGKITRQGMGSLVMRMGYLFIHPVISIIELILNGGF